MTTPSPTSQWLDKYDVLFEEGDYKIVNNDGFSISFIRDSVIIHKCPERDPNTSHHITITQLNQFGNACFYCKQTVPESVQGLYIMLNMDYLDNDSPEHESMHNIYTSPFKNSNDYG